MQNCITAAVVSLALFATVPVLPAAQAHQSRFGTSQTRISKDVARSVASGQFPDSAFERADLEKEQGRLIWSIQLRPHGSNEVHEVQIDALSGELVATGFETKSRDDKSDQDDDRQRDR